MGFKLIRIDAEEPAKIPLKLGIHFVGRGTFLNCDDKRVSRQHGVIKVADDAVVLKSLHQNPCFFYKKHLNEKILLPHGKCVSLSNADQFGLLPDSHWYELIYFDDNSPHPITPLPADQEDRVNIIEIAVGTFSTQYKHRNTLTAAAKDEIRPTSSTINTHYKYKVDGEDDSDSETANLKLSDTMEDNNEGGESQSLLAGDDPGSADPDTTSQTEDFNTTPQDQNTKAPDNQAGDETYSDQTTRGKRSLTPEPSSDTKKIKTEPESPNKAENQKESSVAEANDTNTEPLSPQKPMDVNNEPQNSVDVNETDASTDQDPKDSNTDAESAYGGDTDPPSPDKPCNGVEIKKEPESPKDVKKEPKSPKDEKDPDVAKPGSSHDSGSSSNGDGVAAAKPPNGPGRERCIYGASCYRKNPQHKVQFSHPGDADHGSGARGQCPYGAGCRRRDPRHWAHHDHPAGAAPPHGPPAQGMRVVQRHGQIFYINAHSVHFHDDHFEVEDDDGDSVDYDYEF